MICSLPQIAAAVRGTTFETVRFKKLWFAGAQMTSSLAGTFFMNASSADLLQPFRPYLRVLAELHLDRRLRGKLDASDIVQQTLVRAYPAIEDLRQRQPEVLAAWLRRILASTLADAVRHYERDKRDVGLEIALQAGIDRSSSNLSDWLAASQPSPSQQAEVNEQLLHLVEALSHLPDMMREVVVLKHCQGWKLQQIADHCEKSVPAVASLLRRGLVELRSRMKAGE